MKRWQKNGGVATLVVAAAWLLYRKVRIRQGRLIVLDKSGDAPQAPVVPFDSAPDGVPAEAYVAACNVVSADGVPHSEFRVEQGRVLWRHSLLEHYFDAAWTANGCWLLVGLIKRDDTETPIPDDLDLIIRDFNVLVADLQARRLEPRPAGFC